MKITDNKDMQKSLDLAEDSRESYWKYESFCAALFKGDFRWDLIHPFPTQSNEDKEIGDKLLVKLDGILKNYVDPEEVDRTETLSKKAIVALAEGGFFGLKIPKEYGGLGLSVYNYTRCMALAGSWCGSTAVWLSAHQSIGVPQPVMLFGTDEQKKRYLPRVAKGAISAFALTEPEVGSDPARMGTTATLSEDGQHYILNGEKLWITNGPAAELLVVMAVTPPKIVHGKEKKQVTAFIVETNTPGFEVVHECSFMGIRGIRNGLLRFTNVQVPRENIIGEAGQGLKIALVTLNTGRLTIPAISAAVGKQCMIIAKDWANRRVQWGSKIGAHQAVQTKIAAMSASTFAMESVSILTAAFADQKKMDIRLEAAMAKYFGSEESWNIVDNTIQIRGGRGFETSESLRKRGETPYPLERMLRDLRINRIIEGTSEIMRLFIAREAMDTHLKYIMVLLNPHKTLAEKIKCIIKMIGFYLVWYPKQWISLPKFTRVAHLSRQNRRHLRYIQKCSKKLARTLFHTMVRYQASLEKEQVKLGAFVDIGTDLFAMASSLSRAESLLSQGKQSKEVEPMVHLFCKQARKRIKTNFKIVQRYRNRDDSVTAKGLLDGNYDWLLTGVMGIFDKKPVGEKEAISIE